MHAFRCLLITALFLFSTNGYTNILSESILIKELGSDQFLCDRGDVTTQASPCSTFKIALSLMGFDAGILKNEKDPLWPFPENYPAGIEKWKKPHDPRSWMEDSCVWYSKKLIEELGFQKFSAYMSKLKYGNGDISGEGNSGFANCHLSSSLKISPLEQILFWEKFLQKKLPFSSYAHEMTRNLLFLEDLPNAKLFGKTGLGQIDTLQIGWFVGWVEKRDKIYLVVLMIKGREEEKNAAIKAKEKAKTLLSKLLDIKKKNP